MSDTTKNLIEIYDDVDLCYKVLGLTFSDPPEKVDKVCKGLMDEYGKALRSSDPSIRKSAQTNMEQIQDLYDRITSSLIYKDYAREYEKYKQFKTDQIQVKMQKQQVEKVLLVKCPHCRQLIKSKAKVCIYCNCKILTPTEKLMVKIFTTKNIAVAATLVLVIFAGVVLMLNPQFLRR